MNETFGNRLAKPYQVATLRICTVPSDRRYDNILYDIALYHRRYDNIHYDNPGAVIEKRSAEDMEKD